MNCPGVFNLQFCPERRAVFNQQPVAGRHERDAVRVNQSPGDDVRENFPGFSFNQQIGERSF